MSIHNAISGSPMMGGDLAIDSLVSSKMSAKQAKLDAKEAGKQAKLLAKEAAKHAKLLEKEAAKQAKPHDWDDQKRPEIVDNDDPPRQESSTRDGQLQGQDKIPDISNKDLKFLVFAFYIMGKSVHANKNFDVDQFVQINLLNDEQKFSDMLQQFFKNFNSIFQQFSLFKKNNFIHFHLLADIAFSNQQNIDIDVKLHIVNGKKVLIDKNNIVYHFERHTPIGFWQNNNIVYVE